MQKQNIEQIDTQELPPALQSFRDFLEKHRFKGKPPLSIEQQTYFKTTFHSQVIGPTIRFLSQEKVINNQNFHEQINKIILYSCQICNFRTLIGKLVEEDILGYEQMIDALWGVPSIIMKRNAKKNLLIFYYNYLKLQFSEMEAEKQLDQTAKVMEMVTGEHLGPTTEQLEQLEWIIYLVAFLNEKVQSFVHGVFKRISKTRNRNEFLKIIGLLLSKVMEDRSTTEIIKGYSSHIVHIRQMHYKQSTLYFRFQCQDYQFITSFFHAQVDQYKFNIAKSNTETIQENIDAIMNCLTIFNCALYFGGYSPAIQKKTVDAILPTLLDLLELSYLIYQMCATKVKKMKLQNAFQKNLKDVLRCQEQINLTGEMIGIGQLTAIVRLLANMVHINRQGQEYFEKNIQYFRILLCLTHEDPNQLTMKQWSIMFLRNVSEQSNILREQLSKQKIELKVDPQSVQFHQ